VTNTTVVVERVRNSFSLSFVYDGGIFEITSLKGRKTIDAVIVESDISTDELNIYNAIFDSLLVYSDQTCQTNVSKEELEAQILLYDIVLYIAHRIEFIITIDSFDQVMSDSIEIPIYDSGTDFDLSLEIMNAVSTGYILVGLSLSNDDTYISIQYLKTIVLNINKNITIYATLEADPDYIPPLLPVDYSNEVFVGNWVAMYAGEFGLVSANLELSYDGTYDYITFANGTVICHIWGEYRLVGNDIEVHNLKLEHEYQLISVTDFKIDIRFAMDNMLITDSFIINGMTVYSYKHLLVRGEVRLVNYNGSGICGEYLLVQSVSDGNYVTTLMSSITLRENGTATMTIMSDVNGLATYAVESDGYYRILQDNSIWFISNGELGILDISQFFERYIRTDLDYSTVKAIGMWVALDADAWGFANLIEIDINGMLSAYYESTMFTTNYDVHNDYKYTAIIQLGDQSYIINIELEETNILRFAIINMQDGTVKVFRYNRIDEKNGSVL
jgi:hypothetical protein